jgi:hypothetical protein
MVAALSVPEEREADTDAIQIEDEEKSRGERLQMSEWL